MYTYASSKFERPELPIDELQDEISQVKAAVAYKISRSRKLFFPCEVKFSNDSFQMKVEAEADFDEEESRPDIASFSDILFSHNLDLEDS